MEHVWGQRFLTHFENFFGNMVGQWTFRTSTRCPAIQILEFSRTIPGCRLFCSLGLSHYASEVRHIGEVYIAVDAGGDAVPRLLAEALFLMVRQRLTLGRGTTISGLDAIDPDFTRTWRKNGVYLTLPFNVPNGFENVPLDSRKTGYLLAGLFLAQEECDYITRHSARNFETILENRSVDPYHLARPSCV